MAFKKHEKDKCHKAHTDLMFIVPSTLLEKTTPFGNTTHTLHGQNYPAVGPVQIFRDLF